MKVVLMTNPHTETAVPYVEALLGSSHALVGIVTPQRSLRERAFLPLLQKYGLGFFGMRFRESLWARLRFWIRRTGLLHRRGRYFSVEEWLLDHPLPHLNPPFLKVPSFLGELKRWNPDLILVSTLSQKLDQDLLTLPRYGCINLHAGLLPKERGPAGPFWALSNRQERTGVTFHQMTEAFDAGDILFQKEVSVSPWDTERSLSRKIAETGAKALPDFLDTLEKGRLNPKPQKEGTFRRRPSGQERQALQARESRIRCRYGFFRKVFPVTATPLFLREALPLFEGGALPSLEAFEKAMAERVGRRFAFATGSGKGALYLILKALTQQTSRREVILPAYTDAGLILSIRKAGCLPKLCDISREQLNLTPELLEKVLSEETMAVVAAEMFGFSGPLDALFSLLQARGVVAIEDCAQSFGGSYRGKAFGSFGEASFTSFGKGKNLPTFWGGAILTDNSEWAAEMERELRALPPSLQDRLTVPFLLLGQSLVVHPWVYGTVRKCLTPFRSRTVPTTIRLTGYTGFQAKVALSLLERLGTLTAERRKNGFFWADHLKGMKGLHLPRPSDPEGVAYGQFPVLFEEEGRRKRAQEMLEKVGIESSPFYPHALHHLFPELGGGRGEDPFPNATWVSQRILTLPVHPFLDEARLALGIGCFREALA